MLYPSIDVMLKQVDSKYSLVVAASKRARMLRDGTKSELKNAKSYKYVGVSLEEIYHELISYEKVSKDEEIQDKK
jgi:DNA-directed RNA polymerase subunit omega